MHELVDLLERQAGVVTGRGPAHPTNPNLALRDDLDRFLDDYPSVRVDEGYVQFLERYDGAYRETADATEIVDIFGFGGPSTELVCPGEPAETEDGFLIFAQCIYTQITDGKLVDSYEHDFAFSVTGDRKAGVYLASSTLRTPEQPFGFYVDDFEQWLRRLVDVGGRFARPACD